MGLVSRIGQSYLVLHGPCVDLAGPEEKPQRKSKINEL